MQQPSGRLGRRW